MCQDYIGKTPEFLPKGDYCLFWNHPRQGETLLTLDYSWRFVVSSGEFCQMLVALAQRAGIHISFSNKRICTTIRRDLVRKLVHRREASNGESCFLFQEIDLSRKHQNHASRQ